MRIASPPTTHSCFYGVDTPERSKLLAATHTVEEMAKFIKADSLAFLTMEGLYRAMGRPTRDAAKPAFCDACFSGDYPIGLTDELARPARGPKQLTLLAEYSRSEEPTSELQSLMRLSYAVFCLKKKTIR